MPDILLALLSQPYLRYMLLDCLKNFFSYNAGFEETTPYVDPKLIIDPDPLFNIDLEKILHILNVPVKFTLLSDPTVHPESFQSFLLEILLACTGVHL